MALGHSCGGRSVTVVTESAKTSTRIRVGALPPVMQQKYKNIEIQKYENTKNTNYVSEDIHTYSVWCCRSSHAIDNTSIPSSQVRVLEDAKQELLHFGCHFDSLDIRCIIGNGIMFDDFIISPKLSLRIKIKPGDPRQNVSSLIIMTSLKGWSLRVAGECKIYKLFDVWQRRNDKSQAGTNQSCEFWSLMGGTGDNQTTQLCLWWQPPSPN